MIEYLTLTKPKVLLLLVFTAIIGMLVASDNTLDLPLLFWASIGIALAASSGAVINHIYDKDFDHQMNRTKTRPLATGKITEANALRFAIVLGLFGISILVIFVNPLTAFLTFISLIGYALIYTMLLKYNTSQNIVIGGASGATPPLLGWAAVTNEISVNAIILFLIIFVWTPPHFWALALAKKEEYKMVNIPMLPSTHGVQFTKLSMLFYTVVLWFVCLLPVLTGLSGTLYFFCANLLCLGFLLLVAQLFIKATTENLLLLFAYSITFLSGIFFVLLVDKLVLTI